MKIYFYYVRHGETLFNVQGRMQGSCDSPLTKDGIAMAEDTASALADMEFQAIYSSTCNRAWNTAKIIAVPHQLEPVLLDDLREFDFGKYDGEKFSDFQDEIIAHRKDQDWTDVGGESLPLFKARAERAFQTMIRNSHDGDHILVVSHGAYFRHLLQLFQLDEKLEKRRQEKGLGLIPNCSVSIISWEDGKYTLEQEPMTAAEFRAREKKHVNLYFVRHGETMLNGKQLFQGWCDAPLSAKGKVQAELCAERLQNVSFDRIYTSTMERARKTAEILNEDRHLPVIYEDSLKEIYFGDLEGSKFYFDEQWLRDGFARHHGESNDDLHRRQNLFLAHVIDQAEDGDTILCVTHGIYLLQLRYLLFGIPPEETIGKGKNALPNGGSWKISYEEGVWHTEGWLE